MSRAPAVLLHEVIPFIQGISVEIRSIDQSEYLGEHNMNFAFIFSNGIPVGGVEVSSLRLARALAVSFYVVYMENRLPATPSDHRGDYERFDFVLKNPERGRQMGAAACLCWKELYSWDWVRGEN